MQNLQKGILREPKKNKKGRIPSYLVHFCVLLAFFFAKESFVVVKKCKHLVL